MTGEPTLLKASRVALLTRKTKIAALATRRLVNWALNPSEFASAKTGEINGFVVHRARVPLRSSAPQHPVFEAGKVHNITLAAPAFNGLVITPNSPFSFWKTLGRVTEAGGYRHGMELAGGCIVPAIGGGLCLLARVLFQAAAYAGLHILERHGHSMAAVEPPPGVPFGIDATLLWPYVDLRFAPESGAARLEVFVKDEAVHVNVEASQPLKATIELQAVDEVVALEHDGRIRRNRVLRHWKNEAGQVFRSEQIAVNRTRLLSPERQQRNCLTCNEESCHARVVVPSP